MLPADNNETFRVLGKDIYFSSAEEAQEYAKKHLGTVIVRSNSTCKIPSVRKINKNNKKKKLINITPNMILNHLNKHIISQDDAKRDIAMTLYYHALRSNYRYKKDIKANGTVMLIGPTGSGKTFIIQKACEIIDTVFIHVDTASMVPEGIVGYSIGSLGKDILKLANNNLHKASHCVVFFDEVDKLFFRTEGTNEYGSSIASQLLRLIEGTKIKLHNKFFSSSNEIKQIDTSNMQFILGGAFQWILDDKNNNNSTINFIKSQDEKTDQTNEITLEDLYKANVPKELLGRINSIINLRKLTKEDYYQILTKSESSPLLEFVKKVQMHGDKVEISDETLQQVAEIAANSELGTRAIKQTLKSMFKDALFSAPDDGFKTHKITLG